MIWTLPSLFGQLFDSMMGQMVNVMGGGRPVNRSSPWDAAPRGERLALPPARDAGGAAPPPAAVVWQPAGGGVTVVVERRESEALSPKDLGGDATKLVKYALVSIRRCHEEVLTGGVILVTIPMTSTSFSSWIVARYLQSEEYRAAVERDRGNEVKHADKKYLRVSYGVLSRWPREPETCCDEGKVDALKGIRNALLGLHLPAPAPRYALPPAATAPPPEPAAYGAPSPPAAAAPAGEAPFEEAPAAGEATLSTAGEILAQATESPFPPSPVRLRRPRPKVSAPAPEKPPPPESPRPGRRPPGHPRKGAR
jgi:hypothetical protein